MTARAGWTFNGKHFAETWCTQGRVPVVRCFIDGKPVARKLWKALLAGAKAASEAAPSAAPPRSEPAPTPKEPRS